VDPARQAARAGAAPRNRLKFALGLLIVCRGQKKFDQSLPVSVQVKEKVYIRGYKTAKKVYFDAKKVYIDAKKVYNF
jgi:hypothetical protein